MRRRSFGLERNHDPGKKEEGELSALSLRELPTRL